ncbi:unnamed protein product [Citrullus colocynthis]|uniref:Uncharacterized protein n=1 Tax=Citrullus colocynthis TaxID=252529 RepID=A0ABP0XZB5_9ROSI
MFNGHLNYVGLRILLLSEFANVYCFLHLIKVVCHGNYKNISHIHGTCWKRLRLLEQKNIPIFVAEFELIWPNFVDSMEEFRFLFSVKKFHTEIFAFVPAGGGSGQCGRMSFSFWPTIVHGR